MGQDPSTTGNTNGIQLLGGEMFTWSDFGGRTAVSDGPIARGILAGYTGERGRVLVAGPHEPALVEAAVAGFEDADVLVRSYDDARSLRAQLPASVQVICGPLGALAAGAHGYDLVVALAGVDRLHSAEIDEASWTHAVSHLVGLLSPSGELYLGFGNEVGVDRLLGVDPDPARDDAHWPHGRISTEPPLDLRTLAAHLESSGLGQVENWACFGPRSAPALAVPSGLLEERRRDDVLGRLVEQSFEVASGVAVRDVGRTARELVVHGLGAGVAPGWVLHHARGSEQSRAEFVLVSGSPAYSLRAAARDGVAGWERRDLGAAAAHWLPSTPTLHEQLADACAAHDLAAAGVLVRRYAGWLGEDEVDASRVAVTLSGLVAGPESGQGTLTRLEEDPGTGESAPAPVVLLRSLLVFAHDFLGREARHPWPRSASPEIVAWALAGSAGLEADPERLRQAVALDARLRAPGSAVPSFSSPRSADAFGSVGEMSAALETYADELAAAQAQLRWLVRNIHGRQRTVMRANRNLRKIQTSPEYRLGRRIFWFRALAGKVRDRLTGRRKKLGEWQPAKGEPEGPVPLKVDPALLPPGYKTDGEWI